MVCARDLRRELLWLVAFAVLILACLGLAGRLEPWITPDTLSYFNLGPLPEAFAQPRNPLYGWLFGSLPGGYAAVPAMQVALYLLAVIALYWAARRYGLSARGAVAISISLMMSNVVLLWSNAVIPEMPSVAMAILAIAVLFLMAREGVRFKYVALLSLSSGLAYVLRPTFLPLIVLFPILCFVLCQVRGSILTGKGAAALLLACAFPFLAVSSLRLALVGDFNIVSFGGFQMSGMAGLMLDDGVVQRLPLEARALAEQIVEGRALAETNGLVIPTPLNSVGQRSFVSAALGYYDIYARTYDAVLYGEISKLKGDESWVDWNKRLMRLSISTVLAAPDRYGAWVVGGTSRAVGRLLVTNFPFALGTIVAIAVFFVSISRGRGTDDAAVRTIDLPVILSVVLVYTISAGALMVFVTFPASRYLDSAGVFLASVPIYFALSWWRSKEAACEPRSQVD